MSDYLQLSGLDALSNTLGRIVNSPIEAGSVAEQNVVEVIKSLRVLMNTDVNIYLEILLTSGWLHRRLGQCPAPREHCANFAYPYP